MTLVVAGKGLFKLKLRTDGDCGFSHAKFPLRYHWLSVLHHCEVKQRSVLWVCVFFTSVPDATSSPDHSAVQLCIIFSEVILASLNSSAHPVSSSPHYPELLYESIPQSSSPQIALSNIPSHPSEDGLFPLTAEPIPLICVQFLWVDSKRQSAACF